MKIRLLLSLICILFSSGLLAENWTLLVYMAADNGLSSNAAKDILEMQSADIPPNVNLIVQADFTESSPYTGCRRYKIEHSVSTTISSPIIQELGDVNSGAPETLQAFLSWGFRKYPSDKKMAVIWSHGDSWYKDLESKWICPDETSQALMSIANGDLDIAFQDIPKLDILLFDACSMQSIEVLYAIQHYADYVIGSEDLVPETGFPYQEILPLFSAPITTILDQIPVLYTQSYAALGSQNPNYQDISTTCSAIKTSEIQPFSYKYAAMAINNRTLAPQVLSLRSTLWSMNTLFADVDMREFLTALTTANMTNISIDAVELLGLWDQCVVKSAAIGYTHDVGTAAIWFPEYREYFDGWWSHYYQLEFANKHWLSFLNLAWGEDTTPPQAPLLLSKATILQTLHLKVANIPDPDPLSHRFTLVYNTGSEPAIAQIRRYSDYTKVEIPIREACTVIYELVDLSGNVSDAISFDCSYQAPTDVMIVAPNPIRPRKIGMIKFYMHECEHEYGDLSVYNLRGQLISRTRVLMESAVEGKIYVGSKTDVVLSTGIYFAVLRNGKRQLTAKLCVIPD